jgi:hypothetical protein
VPHGRPTWVKIVICSLYLVRADAPSLLQNAVKRCRSMRCRSVRMVLRRTCVAWPRLRRMRRTMRRETHLRLPLRRSSRRIRKRSIRCVRMPRGTRTTWTLSYPLLVCTMLGPTGGDVPGYRGVVEKAERGTDALRWMLFVRYFGAVCIYEVIVCTSECRMYVYAFRSN